MDVGDGPIPHTWKLRFRGLTTCPKIKEPVLADAGLRPRLLTHTLPLPPQQADIQQADKLVSSVRDERPGKGGAEADVGPEKRGEGVVQGEDMGRVSGLPQGPPGHPLSPPSSVLCPLPP